MEEYSREVRRLCQKLLGFIAMSLGLNKDTFEEMFGVAVQAVRMNYYPPCPRPDLVLGLSPHSDGSALTVLQQGKGSSVGLQILKDNTWVPVQPHPNALVINIGDTMEVRKKCLFFRVNYVYTILLHVKPHFGTWTFNLWESKTCNFGQVEPLPSQHQRKFIS